MAVNTLTQARAMNFTENQQACIILEKLCSQREAGIFCDVVLHVQGQKFQAHRNVLVACSPYFDSVLKTHKVVKEQLTVTCQNLDAFQLLLNYMYTGAVVIDKSNVSELLRLANHFLVIKLKSYCAEYLERYLDPSNCLTVKDMAEKYNLPVLLKSASLYIQNHIIEVLDQNEILEFTYAKLETLFKDKQYTIPQHVLLNFICKWTDYSISKRENDLKPLLALINWDSIERQYLEDHLKTCSLFQKQPKCLYFILVFLDEKQIEVPEFKNTYISLKNQYGPEAVDDNTMDAEPIQDDTKYSGLPEDNIPITVAPLEKEPTPPPPRSTNRRKVTPRKLKPRSPPMQVTMTAKRSTQLQKTVSPTKITHRSSVSSLTPETAAKKETGETLKTPAKPKVQASPTQLNTLVSSRNKKSPKPQKKRYISETDSTDEEEEDGGRSVNGHGSKSKWKDGVKCPNCSYIAHSSVRLEKHVSRIHTKDVTYKCKICDFTCKWNREYYLHVKTHFEGPPFRCENCEYTCDRIQFLLSHRMRHTDERPFKCDECDHGCRTKASLVCHMRCHTGEKPFQCEHCERRFATKARLNKHLAFHREDRPFLCDTCGFSTKYQSHWFSHKKIHTGDVFRCHFPDCKYSTPRKSQLESHLRTHTAVRSHICSICGRAFIEKSHLVRHERIHLNNKPFKCEQCDYWSSRQDKLKEHFRKHHGENATAMGPYKPRKQRRQGYDVSVYSPPHTKHDIKNQMPPTQQQHIELQQSVISTNNPAPVTSSYESSHQETLHSHAAVALQQFGAAAAHNYQVALMEQRHHQPLHHHHHHNPHVGPTPPAAGPTMKTFQNRVNIAAATTHDGTNVVGQPTEFIPFMSFM